MPVYVITSTSGVEMGAYHGLIPTEALVALHHDAGYQAVKYDAATDSIIWPDYDTKQICGGIESWVIVEA